MTTGTVSQCSKKAENHGGPLRKIGSQWVCQECWAKEQGIDVKKSPGKATLCPWCGEVLMTRYRGGKISIKSMGMKGGKATLTCKCGYEKTIKNPFGGTQNRNVAARQRLQSEARRKKHEAAQALREKERATIES